MFKGNEQFGGVYIYSILCSCCIHIFEDNANPSETVSMGRFFRKELSIAFGSLKFYWIYTPVLAYEESLCWVSMHMCLQYKRLNQTSALTACRRQLTSASFLFSSLDILVCGPDETRLAILGADVWQFGFVVRRCSPPAGVMDTCHRSGMLIWDGSMCVKNNSTR